eukprot:jgi/Tetstr1/424415/TSEL_014973.t1
MRPLERAAFLAPRCTWTAAPTTAPTCWRSAAACRATSATGRSSSASRMHKYGADAVQTRGRLAAGQAPRPGAAARLRPNPGTLGLGYGSAGRGAALVADTAPWPDTGVLGGSQEALTEEEVASWGTARHHHRAGGAEQVQWCRTTTFLAALVAARKAAARPGCPHDGRPCLAPGAGGHASPAFWNLAALDAALPICSPAQCEPRTAPLTTSPLCTLFPCR